MGVQNLWEGIPTSAMKLYQWPGEFSKKTGRLPRVAIDMSQMLFQIEHNQWSSGHGIEHRNLMRRLLGFLAVGITPVAVFDGELEREKRRGTAAGGRKGWAWASFAKDICSALGIEIIEAPAEAESQCWYLESQGHVDAIFTNDADVLCHGARHILRYENPKEDATATGSGRSWDRTILVAEVTKPRCSYVMRALLSGNDWHAGVDRIGPEVAARLSDPGDAPFADQLMDICEECASRGLRDPATSPEMVKWRAEVTRELHENRSELLSKRISSASIPESFPAAAAVQALLWPVVSSYQRPDQPKRIDFNSLKSLWSRPSPIKRHRTVATRSSSTSSLPRKSFGPEKQLAAAIAPALLAQMLRDNQPIDANTFESVVARNDIVTLRLGTRPESVFRPEVCAQLDTLDIPRFMVDLHTGISRQITEWSAARKSLRGPRALRAASDDRRLTSFFPVLRKVSVDQNIAKSPPTGRKRAEPDASDTDADEESDIPTGCFGPKFPQPIKSATKAIRTIEPNVDDMVNSDSELEVVAVRHIETVEL